MTTLLCKKMNGTALRLSALQEDDEDDETETPQSVPNGPLQHYRSSRGFGEGPEAPLGRSPLRPTTSNAAGPLALDGDSGDLAKSARVKVTGSSLGSHAELERLCHPR